MFVVDTNVLFTFFWDGSVFSRIAKMGLLLFSPVLALEELAKYAPTIRKKTGLSEVSFEARLRGLKERVSFVPIEVYRSALKDTYWGVREFSSAVELLEDMDFLALAAAYNIPLWSNDALLKSQSFVEVVTTEEVVRRVA